MPRAEAAGATRRPAGRQLRGSDVGVAAAARAEISSRSRNRARARSAIAALGHRAPSHAATPVPTGTRAGAGATCSIASCVQTIHADDCLALPLSCAFGYSKTAVCRGEDKAHANVSFFFGPVLDLLSLPLTTADNAAHLLLLDHFCTRCEVHFEIVASTFRWIPPCFFIGEVRDGAKVIFEGIDRKPHEPCVLPAGCALRMSGLEQAHANRWMACVKSSTGAKVEKPAGAFALLNP